MNVDLVTMSDGEWKGLYIHDLMVYQGHSIPDIEWLKALQRVGNTLGEVGVRNWTCGDEDIINFPQNFHQLKGKVVMEHE